MLLSRPVCTLLYPDPRADVADLTHPIKYLSPVYVADYFNPPGVFDSFHW